MFQDLCVVPMILAIPFLAGRGGSTQEIVLTIGTAVIILGGVAGRGQSPGPVSSVYSHS